MAVRMRTAAKIAASRVGVVMGWVWGIGLGGGVLLVERSQRVSEP
jgi:hypothetical protein